MAPHFLTAIVIAVAPASVAIVALSQNSRGFEDMGNRFDDMGKRIDRVEKQLETIQLDLKEFYRIPG